MRLQKLRTLELYCGCGGLSFADRRTDRVIIETKWAVDYERSMVQTFQANYPYAHVSILPAVARPFAQSSCLRAHCCNKHI